MVRFVGARRQALIEDGKRKHRSEASYLPTTSPAASQADESGLQAGRQGDWSAIPTARLLTPLVACRRGTRLQEKAAEERKRARARARETDAQTNTYAHIQRARARNGRPMHTGWRCAGGCRHTGQ